MKTVTLQVTYGEGGDCEGVLAEENAQKHNNKVSRLVCDFKPLEHGLKYEGVMVVFSASSEQKKRRQGNVNEDVQDNIQQQTKSRISVENERRRENWAVAAGLQ